MSREQDLDDELRSHLAMATDDRVGRGETPRDAAAAAAREFGNVGLIKEATRDVWGFRALDALWQDIRHAARLLAASPGFSVVVVAILALGIGANTAIFSAARAVFVRSLPYPDAARLTYVSRAYPGFPQGGGNFSYPAYRDMLQQNTSFDVLAAYQDFGALALTDGDEPLRVRISYITPSYFDLLGVQTAIGRTFTRDEDRVGDGDSVTVLSFALWQQQYGGAPDIVGRTVHFNQHAFTVIGVAAESFRDALAEHEDPQPVDAWVPLGLAHALTSMSGATDRAGAIDWGVGHLRPGVTIAQANADLSAIAKRLGNMYPATDANYGLVARPLRDQLMGEFYSPLRVLIGGSLFILLIGCANVANLLVARLIGRQREFALRAALGASAGRLTRQITLRAPPDRGARRHCRVRGRRVGRRRPQRLDSEAPPHRHAIPRRSLDAGRFRRRLVADGCALRPRSWSGRRSGRLAQRPWTNAARLRDGPANRGQGARRCGSGARADPARRRRAPAQKPASAHVHRSWLQHAKPADDATGSADPRGTRCPRHARALARCSSTSCGSVPASSPRRCGDPACSVARRG